MARVTFQVIDGIDKGRIFRDLPTPFTIGREEGNLICLNDERVSRCHLKVISDQEDIVILDLDSTNGTIVNGKSVTICRLEIGDCIRLGRTSLLFGSPQEIAQLIARARGELQSSQLVSPVDEPGERTPQVPADLIGDEPVPVQLSPADTVSHVALLLKRTDSPPPVPSGLSPQQAARLVGFLELIHERLARCSREAFYHIEAKNHILIPQHAWHDLLDLHVLVARYIRALTEPDDWEELR
ncbi:MAG: FHA domain-containing protein [Gemmatales bacterium]|nr:FHA domain-containing protein [Gemmatales bacterium]MCS7160724.1 FHA domain-containing protein [Gemmatales bacterium]MDW8175925.1 FHA domain-containing protein [Gemmatales bacterium]MDW8222814.1 FHA domain-containing protein [Gemmatales bacterium]